MDGNFDNANGSGSDQSVWTTVSQNIAANQIKDFTLRKIRFNGTFKSVVDCTFPQSSSK